MRFVPFLACRQAMSVAKKQSLNCASHLSVRPGVTMPAGQAGNDGVTVCWCPSVIVLHFYKTLRNNCFTLLRTEQAYPEKDMVGFQ
ncbi:hypothetical protein [Mucilaginibacter ginsenosidivorans]|uniref:Uncharacterized protein n=1 Tax=Mucilaginibacter ginsenosidivorans TaxID=398053 RepID=A0A5B8URV3_9SPHI|nr:hypothetical protein [Mucilaginibacter ginsenosidivorans]QEC61146.1 hypothetical protein FRZ54_00640 [Mucilaginibacter ginsenosidivorans]